MNLMIDISKDKYDEIMSMGCIDDECKKCKKDWTKCGKCPVMMKWVREVRDKE